MQFLSITGNANEMWNFFRYTKIIINKCQENVLNVHKAEVNFFLTFFEIMHFSLLLPIR